MHVLLCKQAASLDDIFRVAGCCIHDGRIRWNKLNVVDYEPANDFAGRQAQEKNIALSEYVGSFGASRTSQSDQPFSTRQ